MVLVELFAQVQARVEHGEDRERALTRVLQVQQLVDLGCVERQTLADGGHGGLDLGDREVLGLVRGEHIANTGEGGVET